MLYPMAMMVLLTLMVGVVAAITRYISVRSRAVRLGYFKLMQGQDVPARITITSRCFNNMFEVPVLFYVVCALYVSLGVGSLYGSILAWLFVALRCVQALVHLTFNGLLARMLSFWASFICVVLLWANLVI